MKSYISIILALVLCLSLFCVSAYSVNDVVVDDSGRGNLDQWVVSFTLNQSNSRSFSDATSKVPTILNEYCSDNNCEVINISIAAQGAGAYLMVVAIVEK